jgi:hypothetical protein
VWICRGLFFTFFTFVVGMKTARTFPCQALLVVGLLLACLHAQSVGIGTATPHPLARLHISDNARGLLIPNVALTATSVAAPVTGPATTLLVSNTATAGIPLTTSHQAFTTGMEASGCGLQMAERPGSSMATLARTS